MSQKMHYFCIDSGLNVFLIQLLAIQLYVIVIIFVQHLYSLFCLLVTKNILLARKKTLAIIIALLDDVGAAITDNQTWFTFILFSVENVILRVFRH